MTPPSTTSLEPGIAVSRAPSSPPVQLSATADREIARATAARARPPRDRRRLRRRSHSPTRARSRVAASIKQRIGFVRRNVAHREAQVDAGDRRQIRERHAERAAAPSCRSGRRAATRRCRSCAACASGRPCRPRLRALRAAGAACRRACRASRAERRGASRPSGRARPRARCPAPTRDGSLISSRRRESSPAAVRRRAAAG